MTWRHCLRIGNKTEDLTQPLYRMFICGKPPMPIRSAATKTLVRAQHGNAMNASAEMWAQGTLQGRTDGQCHDELETKSSYDVVPFPVPEQRNDLDRIWHNLTWVQGYWSEDSRVQGTGHKATQRGAAQQISKIENSDALRDFATLVPC
ncbi:uncharacterized protein UHOD_01578 [Ustilago sp. UG-2017b]|nr:uncharacterized protein UHOD_01578 [Ustilago sp. UG-2017b]